MKTLILFVFFSSLTLLLSDTANSQWRLNAYGGYGFDDEIEEVTSGNNYFRGTVSGSGFWGAGVEYILKRNYGIELLYMREDTEVPISYTTASSLRDTNISPGLGMNFIMLTGNGYTTFPDSPVELFGGVMLGMAIFENKDPLPNSESSSTKFGYGFRAGTNIWFTDAVGLKIMGQFLSAAQAFGGGFYVGTGGISAGVNPESSMFQFGLGGGLTFKLGKSGMTKVKR